MSRGALPLDRRSKYGAVRTVCDGITFHSKREATRYAELRLLEKAGEIHKLMLQRRLVLLVPAKDAPSTHPLKKIGEYVADFVYCECRRGAKCIESQGVVEDVKGFRTPLYRWKKKHVEAQYGIQIKEV